MRDLVRARTTAVCVPSKARQHLRSFLLRHDRVYHMLRAWTLAYRRWLTIPRAKSPRENGGEKAFCNGSKDNYNNIAMGRPDCAVTLALCARISLVWSLSKYNTIFGQI